MSTGTYPLPADHIRPTAWDKPAHWTWQVTQDTTLHHHPAFKDNQPDWFLWVGMKHRCLSEAEAVGLLEDVKALREHAGRLVEVSK